MAIELIVEDKDIEFAKKQISEFEKSPKGNWRYSGVEAWRGIVCEMLTSNWLKENFNVTIPAKGLDTSGIYDSFDLIINNNGIEIKSATCFNYKLIKPKKSTVDLHPNNICIGIRYDELSLPNKVIIFGFLENNEIQRFSTGQNKGAPYYDVPQTCFHSIDELNKHLKA